MNDQRCGTCRYYLPVVDDPWGYCRWREGRDVPYFLESAHWRGIYPKDGGRCKAWQAKEETT